MILYRLVGFLYLVSGIWCLMRPDLAAAYVGFSWSNAIALSEFVAVYGGLQIGIALAVFYTSRSSEDVTGLQYTLILSVSLLMARIYGLWRYGSSNELIAMMLIELVIVVMLLMSLRSTKRQ